MPSAKPARVRMEQEGNGRSDKETWSREARDHGFHGASYEK